MPTRLILTALVALLGACSSPSSDDVANREPETALLGPGDVERGRKAFGQCRSCHAIEAGVNRVGPSLFGVVDRRAGGVDGYAYSKAMGDSGLTWTEAELDAYLTAPRREVPGTKMSFAGLSNPQARRDLIAYLATLK
jgi:cytochrome c